MTAADAGGPDSPTAPVVATWEGRDPRRRSAGGPRAARSRREGYPLGRFARLDALGGAVTPGLVDPHTHLLFAGSREDELELRQRGAGYMEILAAGGGILSTVARDAGRDRRRARARTAGAGSTRCSATGRRRSRRSPATGSISQTELRLLEVAHELGQAGPIDIVPTYLGAHAVPPEFRGRPDGVEAYVRSVIDEQLPGRRRPGHGPGSATCSARRARSRPTSRERILSAAAVAGAGAAAPRRRARAVRRRGAGRGDRCGIGRPPRRAVGGRHRRAGRRGRRGPTGRRDRAAGDDVVPDEARATRRPGRSSSAGSRSRSGPTSTRARRRRPRCRWR